MYIDIHVKYPLLFQGFNESLRFSNRISKKAQILNLMKIRPMGAELFRADGRVVGQIEMSKLVYTFRNFTNAPKIGSSAARYVRHRRSIFDE